MELGRELKMTSLSYTATKFFTYDNTIKTLLEMLDQLGQILTHLNVDAFQAFRYVFLSKSLRFSQKKGLKRNPIAAFLNMIPTTLTKRLKFQTC